MILPVDIAAEAHKHCSTNPKAHDIYEHIDTSREYARYLNATTLNPTPEQVIRAIIDLGGDPDKGEWRGHPHPDLVLKYLGERNDS